MCMSRNEFKEKIMKSIQGKSRAEAIEFLNDRIFMVNMADHLSQDDYDFMSIAREIVRELENEKV